ncbi:MAG TPA: hypothetical protein VL283_01750, partial [Candidatus Baltobacteraceae bacterium]|nr:hypothetical protein [Candidatus Baltobacteraceae bacterium]
MPSENFAAWDLDPSLFDSLKPEERLAFLVRFAVLAPSGHNSQPWKFIVESGAIVAAPDMARALPHSDADHRQMYLSLGCAIENLCAAADYYGYGTELSRIDLDGAPAWRVRVIGAPRPPAERQTGHRALAAARRRTNRNKYAARPPEPAFIDWLRGLAAGETQVRIVDRDPLKARIADVVSDALLEA